jgi:hypothetical protein
MVAGKILGELCRFSSSELRIGGKKEAHMTCICIICAAMVHRITSFFA